MSTERVVSSRAHYGRCPESLLFSDAPDAQCRLYAALTTYDYGQSGACYPGREVVAKRLGWSVRTLDRHFAGLEARKALKRSRQGRGNVNLIVLLADVDESPEMAGQLMSRQIDPDESPDGVTHPLTNEKNDREERAPKKRRTQLTDPDWQPSEATKEWARQEYPEQAKQATLAAFRDYHMARGTPFLDWERAFRTWVRKADEFAAKNAERGPSRTYL